VPIAFFSLLDDDGWMPLSIDAKSPTFSWSDGGSLADAPVDVEATFDGAMWYSTKVDRSFHMTGLRCRPDFTVPPHHHSLRLLVIVFGGEFFVEAGKHRRRVGPGQFWVVDAGTSYVMTAGPAGATFTESFPLDGGELETCWHDGPGWVRR
jgi:quercetin dioxygenase-like cupin family protein